MYNNYYLVIYGASSGGQKVEKCFRSFNIEVDFFTDSNEKKWGTTVNGVPVCSPQSLIGKEVKIVIASDVGYTNIRNYLSEMNLINSCILREEILLPHIDDLYQLMCKEGSLVKESNISKRQTIFVELLEGYQLGGIENWSYMIAKGLKEKERQIEILSKKVTDLPHEWEDIITDSFDGEFENYKNCVRDLVMYMSKKLPCIIVLNKQQQLFYAGHILKKIYPDQVKIYSVLHNDLESIYDRNRMFDWEMEGFLCVSNKIKAMMADKYHIEEKKLHYKESPIFFDTPSNPMMKNQKSYNINRENPIHIAYGARLEKVQKRADLLIPLIEELEIRTVNYVLHIAGDGEYYTIIRDYVEKHKLQNKVKLYGCIQHNEMKKFWLMTDVFINLSEMEGVGISMLEAMSCGNVPIEFEVAGCDEFIKNNENGYILVQGDYVTMADKIQYLSEHRDQLVNMGEKSICIACKKCDLDDYIEYLMRIFDQ